MKERKRGQRLPLFFHEANTNPFFKGKTRSNAFLRGEGTSTSACAFSLRILYGKTRPLQAIHIIHFRTIQERSALGIHNNLDIPFLNHRVIITQFILKGHTILIPTTATPFDVNTQPNGTLLFFYQFPNFFLRHISNRNHPANLRLYKWLKRKDHRGLLPTSSKFILAIT